jgi:hypothetical protein
VAPLLFAGLVVGLAAVSAPTWAYVAALVAAGGVVLVGVTATRSDRTRTAPRLNFRQLLGSGGFRFLIFAIAAVIMLLLTFHA